MAQLTIIYWRDDPAQGVVKAGHAPAKRQLDEHFQEAIDLAAMRARRNEADDYLAEWRRGKSEPCGDDCEAEAAKAQSRIEAEYDDDKLKSLVAAGGRDNG
ncbi:MAG: virulence factor [Rhodospirillales bacterium]